MKARSSMSLRAKMTLFYSVLVVLPLILFGIIYYQLSAKNIADLATRNLTYTNQSKRQLMDQQLRSIEDSILAINVDADLFQLLSKNYATDYEIKQADAKITEILGKYFKNTTALSTVNIVTEQYTYGSPTVVTARDLFDSELYKAAKTGTNWINWIPTYYIPQQFKIDYLNGIQDDSLFSFSAIAVMNPVYININNRAVKQEFPPDMQKPVLILSFSPDFFGSAYQDAVSLPGALFCVSDESGAIISHPDTSLISTSQALPWLADPAGASLRQFDYMDHRMLVSCEYSEVTNWVLAIAVPMDELLRDVTDLLPWLIGLEVLLTCLALLIVYAITVGITRPVKELTGALKLVGQGNFGGQIPVNTGGEIGYLIEKFNEMSSNIHVLIDENYKVRLREKEAEITALNTQLNPHLLYNTLNIINLQAIDHGETEISQMLISLSRMLQYTVMNRHEMADLSEDMKWLKRYLYIMSLRYEGLFTVSFRFDKGCEREKVPKLFLQPFVENAIIHGFKGKNAGCEIQVTGVIENGKRVFRVWDNGNGIADDRQKELFDVNSTSVGIANVIKRVELIYGSEGKVEIKSEIGSGTTVIITLP